jgi:hypothetical protein
MNVYDYLVALERWLLAPLWRLPFFRSDFTLKAYPARESVRLPAANGPRPVSVYFYLSVAQVQGLPQTVTVRVAGLPPGVSWVVTPQQAVPTFTSVVRVDVGSLGLPTPGRYSVFVEARGQSQTRRTQVSLDVL